MRFKKGDRAITRGTTYLPDGQEIEIIAGGNDAHGDNWNVRVISADPKYQGLCAYWYVADRCLFKKGETSESL